MTFTLLNSTLLGFAALAVVPLLAHLFAKARPRELPFPSLQWLRQAERTTARLRRPKDGLLLLLRTLAVAAVIAAFLQPLLFTSAQLAASDARKTLVLVVDRSASMAFVEQGRSRFTRATAQAEEILKAAGPRALANIVWLDAAPAPEFPEPAVNLDALRDTLRRANVTLEPGDTGGALRAALEQLGRGEGARELHVLSDFQSAAWKDAALSIPPNVKLLLLPAAATEAANTALTSLVVQPERPVSGAECRVLCRVRNFSPATHQTTVQLAFAESRQSRPLTLPPWGEGVAEFRVLCGAPGQQSLSATLPEDAFPADDRRFATLEIRENWRAVLEGPEQDANLVLWRRALASLGWLNLDGSVEGAEIHLGIRTSPDHAAGLRATAERGAAVICQPGADWDAASWAAFWGGEAGENPPRLEERRRDQEPPWTLQTAREDHPMWQIFRGGEYGDPAAGSVWRRMNLPASAEDILLRYNDGVPALAARRAGQGWVILWNIELDEAVSDRAQQSSFLIMLGELLLHHGESARVSSARGFIPLRNLFWQPAQPVAQDQVRLEDGAGKDWPFIHDAAVSPPLFSARDPLPPGNYKWLLDALPAERASVNFPADEESDLRTLDPATLGIGSTLSLSAAAALTAQRDGLPLWPWLLGAALVFLLLESLIAKVAQAPGAIANSQ